MKNKVVLYIVLTVFFTGCSTPVKKQIEQNKVKLNGTSLTFEKPTGYSVLQKSRQVYDETLKKGIALSLVKVYPSKKLTFEIEISKILNFKNISDFYSKQNSYQRKYHIRPTKIKINNNNAVESSFESKLHRHTVKYGGQTFVYENHSFVIESAKSLYKCSLKTPKTTTKDFLVAQNTLIKICKSIRIQ